MTWQSLPRGTGIGPFTGGANQVSSPPAPDLVGGMVLTTSWEPGSGSTSRLRRETSMSSAHLPRNQPEWMHAAMMSESSV